MKKLLAILALSLVCVLSVVGFAACGVNFKINFIVDGEIYATVSTNGGETIKMPDNPVKENYTFDGWFWDKDVWEKPFTANSLLDAPLSSDMSVYAKFTKKHEHNYIATVTEPTCTEKGYTTYTCACGESYTGDDVNELGHDYNAVVTEPTCTENGYTTHSCSRCKDSYTDTYTNALDHNFGDWTLTKAPTCTETGIETRYCSHDNTHTETKTVNKLDHKFTNYVYDNNATYDEDGTKTAVCDRGCGATDTVTAENTKFKSEIVFKTLTVDEELNVYGKVANTKTTFSFVNEVEVKGNATFVVSTDIYGMQQIPTKTVPIEIGDNTFYITETVGNDIRLFTVTVRRRPVYTVSFNTDGGSAVSERYVEEDDFATEPTTTKAGYTFTGWNYAFNTPITKNTTVTASWTANTNTPYAVEYYWQNLEDDNYSLQETNNLTGTTNTTAIAAVKEYEHFTHTSVSQSVESAIINGNGNTVLRVYYTRDIYEFTVTNENTKGGTIYCTDNGSYRFGKQINLSATVNDGYDFVGWYNGETKISDKLQYTFNIAKNNDITAKYFAHTDTPYRIEYYLENLENDEYTLKESDTEYLTGTTDTIARKSIDKTYEHFTIKNDTASGNINGNGTTVLKVYYTRDVYSVIISASKNIAIDQEYIDTYKYGFIIPEITATFNDYLGYEWQGWYSGADLVCKNMVLPSFTVKKAIKYVAKCKIKEEMSNFTFNSDENTCEITNVKDKTIIKTIIPNYVTSIKNNAFKNCGALTSISIPDSVTSIGNNAFDNCHALTSVTLGKSVTSIGGAFSNCFKLIEVINRSGLDITKGSRDYGGIGYYAITIHSGESKIINQDGYLFIKDGETNYLLGYENKNSHLVLPDSYNGEDYEIYKYAFYNCDCLTSIIIPDDIMNIGDSAFHNCHSLTSVALGNNITSIGYYAFYSCSSLKSIIIPDSVTSIRAYAFVGCSSLNDVTIGNSVTSIGERAFGHCTSLKSIIIPDSVTRISDHAFYNCSGLTKVTIGNGIIGPSAFSGCSDLTNVTVGNSVTGIASFAFENCSNLKKVTIGSSVATISYYAFENCAKLTSVYYKGVAEDWVKITIASDNSPLTSATRYYYSETEPVDDGKYWHYDTDGITPVVWVKEN